MFAYTFWHWRRPEVDAATYEAAQRRFHAALAAAPSPGFSRSHSAALRGAPWAADGGGAYEDWYLIEGTAALDPLNHAAVNAPRRKPHDAAAVLAAGGAAGVYTVRHGAPLAAPPLALWFAKPEGMTYAQLDAELRHHVAKGACLWMRYMVLGPTPEFCLHSFAPVQLPPPFATIALDLRPVWP